MLTDGVGVIAHYNPSIKNGRVVVSAKLFFVALKMALSSINIQPVRPTSEAHNQRTVELDYTLPHYHIDRFNDQRVKETISDRFKTISERYEKSVGQKMQEKATPIREAVINLKPETRIHHLKDLSDKLEAKFGIKAFQIYIHDDEGFVNPETDEVKRNRHAHIVFDWTDNETGKTLKLHRFDMSKMQTIVAESLGMERGSSSDKEHLNSLQYKEKMAAERILYLEEKAKVMLDNIQLIREGKLTEQDIERITDQKVDFINEEKSLDRDEKDFGTRDKKEIKKVKELRKKIRGRGI